MMRLATLTTAIFIALAAHSQSYNELIKEGTRKLEKGEVQAAIKDYNDAIELEPDNRNNEFAYANLALAYIKSGNTEKAEKMYSAALSLHPSSVKLLQQRGNLYLMEEKWEQALADYDSIIHKEPFNEEALYYRAYIHTTRKNYGKAYEDYYKILTANPENHKARFALALLYSKNKKSEEALLLLDHLIEKNPNVPEYHSACSDIVKAQKKEELALVYIEEGLSKCKESDALLVEKAQLLIAMKRKEEAKRILDHLTLKGHSTPLIKSLYKRCR